MRSASAGHAVFAVTLLAMGILGLIKGDFAPLWEPPLKDVPAREVLVYLSALISLGSGIGLLWRRSAAIAARTLLTFLLLWLLLFKVPPIFSAPTAEVSYESCGETAVIVAAAWILYAWLGTQRDQPRPGFTASGTGVRIARGLYGLALIAFGLSHFAYVKETAVLVPDWLPSPAFWAHFTGCTYLAAGLAVLIGTYARLATALAALQMGLFTLLVWVPMVVAGGNASQWSELVLSWVLTVSGWVVAESCRGLPWLAPWARDSTKLTY